MALAAHIAGPTGPILDDGKVKALAADFRNAQVKILSFVTYLLRQFPTVVRQHQVRVVEDSSIAYLMYSMHAKQCEQLTHDLPMTCELWCYCLIACSHMHP